MAVRTPVAAVTDVGQVRDHNEDTYLVRADLGLYLVADGMGGHQAGDVASAMVRLSVADFFEMTRDAGWPEELDRDGDEGFLPPARRLAAAIRKANRDVHLAANASSAHYGMGSTVVAAHTPPGTDKMHIGHVGDSRCYRIRDAKLEALTRDHSLVGEALALDPDMPQAELDLLPHNIITRALGVDYEVEVDLQTIETRRGDTYLLCSDGLSGLISNDEILEAMALLDDADEVCNLLVALANEAGGHDNITALVLKT